MYSLKNGNLVSPVRHTWEPSDFSTQSFHFESGETSFTLVYSQKNKTWHSLGRKHVNKNCSKINSLCNLAVYLGYAD